MADCWWGGFWLVVWVCGMGVCLELGDFREKRGVGGRNGYLCLGYFGVGGDVAVVLSGDLGFSLAEVFAGGVEGGFGHDCGGALLSVLDGVYMKIWWWLCGSC